MPLYLNDGPSMYNLPADITASYLPLSCVFVDGKELFVSVDDFFVYTNHSVHSPFLSAVYLSVVLVLSV